MTDKHSIAEARRNLPRLVREAERGMAVELTRRGARRREGARSGEPARNGGAADVAPPVSGKSVDKFSIASTDAVNRSRC